MDGGDGHDGGGVAHQGGRAGGGKQDDLVGVLDDAFQAVFGQQDRRPEVMDQPLEHGEDLLGRGRIEGRRRLVQDQHLGVRGEYRADRHPLHLAAGERGEGPLAQVGQTQQVQRLLDTAAHHVRGEAQRLHTVGQLVLDGVGDEMGQRVLAHCADDIGQFARRVGAGVPAVDGDPAAQGAAGEMRDEPADGLEQGGLADAGGADQQAQLALGNGQVDALDGGRGGVPVGDRDLLEPDQRLGSFVNGAADRGAPAP